LTEEIEEKKRDKVGRQARIKIDAAVVKAEAALAAEAVAGDVRIYDTNDAQQPYLTLRRCGRRLSWLVRAYKRTRVFGAANSPRNVGSDYLGVAAAREKAKGVYEDLRTAAGVEATPEPAAPTGWTWADLDREYQESLKEPRLRGNKVKPPSRGTRDDVRLMFKKPSVAALGPTLLTAMVPLDIVRAVDAVHAENGHRVSAKTLAYIKSALSWALSKRGEKSGLHASMPWWAALRPPDPTGTEIVAMQARRKDLIQKKVGFGIDHMADLLIAHEAHCADRTAEEKVSPGIRWGLWWVCFTANRRGSTVALERERLRQVDEFGRDRWGRAEWTPETMKGRSDFWLPLPPDVLHVANSCVADWSSLVMRSTGAVASRWVFASTRRIGRDPTNEDVAVYPNSLNHHLRVLRGQKKRGKEGEKGPNKLGDLPWFSLHLARSVIGDYLDTAPGVPKAAISAMLAHADENIDDRLAPTTKAFYINNQRMELKSVAIQAWSEALRTAYEKRGGRWPEPSEPPVNPLLMAS
jgi:hypothetical protein